MWSHHGDVSEIPFEPRYLSKMVIVMFGDEVREIDGAHGLLQPRMEGDSFDK
jgi:hypothetical protein